MIRLSRPPVCILLLVGLLLAVVAGAAGAYLALKQSGSDSEEGFLAHGQVSAAILGVDVDTPQSRRCLAKSDQAATTAWLTFTIWPCRGRFPLRHSSDEHSAGARRRPAGMRCSGIFPQLFLRKTGSLATERHCSGIQVQAVRVV